MSYDYAKLDIHAFDAKLTQLCSASSRGFPNFFCPRAT